MKMFMNYELGAEAILMVFLFATYMRRKKRIMEWSFENRDFVRRHDQINDAITFIERRAADKMEDASPESISLNKFGQSFPDICAIVLIVLHWNDEQQVNTTVNRIIRTSCR